MRLDLSTWEEIEAYLEKNDGVILPVGSVEQHGPIGLIGTDALCAQSIAELAAELGGALVAPVLAYAPAGFNMGFAGTVTLRGETFEALVADVIDSLVHHGFGHVYVLNAHGANLQHLHSVASRREMANIRIRSWWDFETVNTIRRSLYGEWEGMHATPSEVAITQAMYRVVDHRELMPPEKLSAAYIQAHAGDRHGPADQHRKRFPDGRVGSHSSLASPGDGHRLLKAAARAVADDFARFIGDRVTP